MAPHIDYYVSLNSPWSHLGAARVTALAARHGATIRVHPVDFGTIFPVTGGLPLPKRAPARQAYRLVELQRWRAHLEIPLTLKPRHYPFSELRAASCVIAARETIGEMQALALAHRILKALWEEERDPGDTETLAALITEIDLDARALLAAAESPVWLQHRESDTRSALEKGVFGAPSYVLNGEIFWGQDRLDFLARSFPPT